MQMKLVLCICILYQILSCIGADDSDDDWKTNEDNYALSRISTEKSLDIINEENKEYEAEKKQGELADLFGTNQHHNYPDSYKDLGRRFVPQYPYIEVSGIDEAEADLDRNVKAFNRAKNNLIPMKAPPELVLAVATRAALAEAQNPKDLSEENINKEMLRSGNYWNDVWREDVDPSILRTHNENDIQSIKVKIMPGSALYELVSELKKISPKLVYVINK